MKAYKMKGAADEPPNLVVAIAVAAFAWGVVLAISYAVYQAFS